MTSIKMCANCSHRYTITFGIPDRDGVCRMCMTVAKCDAYSDRPDIVAGYHCDKWEGQE